MIEVTMELKKSQLTDKGWMYIHDGEYHFGPYPRIKFLVQSYSEVNTIITKNAYLVENINIDFNKQ